MIQKIIYTDIYLLDTSIKGTIWSAWKKVSGPDPLYPQIHTCFNSITDLISSIISAQIFIKTKQLICRILDLRIKILVHKFLTPTAAIQQQKPSSRVNRIYSAQLKQNFKTFSFFKNFRSQLFISSFQIRNTIYIIFSMQCNVFHEDSSEFPG